MPTIDPELLSRAVARGLISAAQAEGLDRLSREDGAGAPGTPAPERDLADDPERLRFVTGFADIFVTLGIALFLGAAFYLGSLHAGPAPAAAGVALLSWGLAELFSRRRRMALPSIALLAAFSGAVFLAVASSIAAWLGTPARFDALQGLSLALSFAAMLGAALLHYRRFRVPITVAAGAAAAAGIVLGLAQAALPGLSTLSFNTLVSALGLTIFSLAMRYDLADPQRLTRRTDIAFWLHLLAAPMIVHPVLAPFVRGGAVSAAGAAAILAVVLLLSLVALATDRRAILVAGLVYAGIATGWLIRRAGLEGSVVPLSLLVLGAFVLMLGAGWQALRRPVLGALPSRLAARLPHPVGVR